LQRQWYQQNTGTVVEFSGKAFRCQIHPWRSATVDGLLNNETVVWEAKHVNAFAKPEEVLEKYMPQLQHNMAVVGVNKSVLSMFLGTFKWETFEVDADWLYQEELLAAETAFWNAVQTGDLPCAAAPPAAPKPTTFREVDFTGNNAWGAYAADWLDNRDFAKSFKSTEAAIKELIEPDVSKATGHGIIVKRSKAGALTITEAK
jgi:predicted phage-related endonuclease